VDESTTLSALDPTTTVGSVAEGDLIFANRGFWLQRLCDLAGDPWLHVGIAAVVDGQMSIVEVGPDGCASRPLAEITGGYRMMGIARLPMARRSTCVDDCRGRVVDWARSQIGRPLNYAWEELNLAGWGALFARMAGRRRDSLVAPAARAIGKLFDERDSSHLFCSSFVIAALDQCCDLCRPVVTPLTVASTIPAQLAGNAGPRESATVRPAAGRGYRRVFTTPTDLWRSVDAERLLLSVEAGSETFPQPSLLAVA
jgi:hypothetical protein